MTTHDENGKEFKTVLDWCASLRGRDMKPSQSNKPADSSKPEGEEKHPEGEFIG